MYLMTLLNNTGVQRGLVTMQAHEFESLIDGDFARFSEDASGGFVSRFINDVNAIRDAALRFANNFTKSTATTIGCLGVMAWIDWQLTLLILVAYPIAFAPVISLGNRVRTPWQQAYPESLYLTAPDGGPLHIAGQSGHLVCIHERPLDSAPFYCRGTMTGRFAGEAMRDLQVPQP